MLSLIEIGRWFQSFYIPIPFRNGLQNVSFRTCSCAYDLHTEFLILHLDASFVVTIKPICK
jgi:hypothetical protein